MRYRLRTLHPMAFGLLPLVACNPAAAQTAQTVASAVSVDAAVTPAVAESEAEGEAAPAELPAAVRAMVEAALATKDRNKILAVIDIAKTTNPEHKAELDVYLAAFQKEQQEMRVAAAAAAQEKLRNAGLLEQWSGTGQIGGFKSSGNSDNAGLSLALTLQRKGIDWRHLLRSRIDYQQARGVTSKEQYLFAYEPRYDINKSVFSYALGQYEKDRFQGFTSRYSVSGGFGYRIIDNKSVSLTAQAGPAWRRTDFISGVSDSNLAGLISLDFDWKITDRVTFSHDTNMVSDAGGRGTVFISPNNTSLSLITGLDFKLNKRLSTRITYSLDYNSKPPAGSVSTDSLTRFTLAYGF